MTAERLPIQLVRTNKSHISPKEMVLCPKSGSLVNVGRCRDCEDVRIILANCVKCLHNPKKNAKQHVLSFTI